MQYTTAPILVRYSDTDQMKFVHHSNYLRYFEIARLEWLRAMGISYKKMEEDQLLLPVVDAYVKYHRPTFFEDQLTVTVFLKSMPKASLDFNYEIRNQDYVCVCTGSTKLAFLDAISQRPIRCPKILYNAFESFRVAE
ncbi:MAG: thioesterase family protein [Bacteroidetes bacterium]|nr:thioesterase family protein [Bacteroidota bacterium]MDA0937604.1 thioesterase family protein [Bacteroidota bacterium]MDA1344997.1 thioesterase family protein [Bacteroidota bacterium]